MSIICFKICAQPSKLADRNQCDFPDFKTIHTNLNNAKTQYDEPYKNNIRRFYTVTRSLNLDTQFKHHINSVYNTPNVSNAWLKGYEIISHYKLIPKTAADFTYFDNAAFPGSFILAAHHYQSTKCNISRFHWLASSLLDKTALQDKYKLYRNYRNNWVMNLHNNGDVTKSENIQELRKCFGGTVDLYTSDLGFDVSQDYNKQEELHAIPNLGQILTGLVLLKPGGNMVTKQYTCFHPFTVSLLNIMTQLFTSVELCKPVFSKPANSETYLVCLNYIPNTNIRKKMFAYLQTCDKSLQPLVSDIDIKFRESIIDTQTHFTSRQIQAINKTIKMYYNNNNDIKRIKRGNRRITDDWKRRHHLIRLTPEKKLNVKETITFKRR